MTLKLVFCLLYCLHLWRYQTCLGEFYSLDCFNDYLFTITCELNLSSKLPIQDGAYFLEFTDDRGTFKCVFKSQIYSWVCVLNLSLLVEDSFTDTDIFKVNFNSSLHDKDSLEVQSMPREFEPVNHIRPNPPSNLGFMWGKYNATFNWSSGYNEDVPLVPHLTYQLSIRSNNKVWTIHSPHTHMLIPVSSFTSNTDYTAQVRSKPKGVHYKGVWSQWGPAIQWTTGSSSVSAPHWLSLLLILLLPITFVLYYLLKKCVSSQSPVPFVGDFKRSMPLLTAEKLLQQESSLKFESMIEACDSGIQPNPVYFVFDTSGNATMLRSPSMLQHSDKSENGLGSWSHAFITAEKKSTMCSLDYCTLTDPPTV